MRRCERAENTMLKWMCGVNAELMDCLGVVSVREVVSCRPLRWYGHVKRIDNELPCFGLQGITS